MITFDEHNFKNKRVIVRVDFNVPLNDRFEITDNTRIKAAIPTLSKVLSDGGSLIVMSHLGRPKGSPQEKFSLKHIVKDFSDELGSQVQFVNDCVGKEVEETVANLKRGEVLLLENLRFHNEETEGDEAFAKKLAHLADFYINDAFGTSHRAHASTAIIANYFSTENKSFGHLIESELKAVSKVLENPSRPFTAVMGGAKVSDKILLIERMLDKVDNLIIGGGMSYTFFKAQGGEIGNSLVEEDKLDLALKIIKLAEEKGVKLHLPKDSIVADKFANDAKIISSINMNIPEGYMGLDIGEGAIADFSDVIHKSKTILWNGPMGVFEMSNFENGTKSVGKAIADSTKNGAYSLIGGGDSAAAVNKFGLGKEVSYISTGGGALLELLEGKDLPGISAIIA